MEKLFVEASEFKFSSNNPVTSPLSVHLGLTDKLLPFVHSDWLTWHVRPAHLSPALWGENAHDWWLADGRGVA